MDFMLKVNSPRKYSEKKFIFKYTQAQQVYTKNITFAIYQSLLMFTLFLGRYRQKMIGYFTLVDKTNFQTSHGHYIIYNHLYMT